MWQNSCKNMSPMFWDWKMDMITFSNRTRAELFHSTSRPLLSEPRKQRDR